MRTAGIPAQIITVEDRIAGNLTFTQIAILMIPLISAMSIYMALPPLMKFSPPKILITCCIALVASFLAIRIKGKIVMQWIIIILRYNLRPGYYIYNKNDSSQRTIETPLIKKKTAEILTKEQRAPEREMHSPTISDVVRFEKILADPKLSLKFKMNTKGGLTIALNQIEK